MLFFLCLIVTTSSATQDHFRLDSLQQALSRNIPDSSRILTLLALTREQGNSDYIESATYALQALDLAAKLKDKRWLATVNRAVANLYFDMGDYKKASAHYFDALGYYTSQQDTIGVAIIYTNLGAMQDRLYEYDKALTYYQKALSMVSGISAQHKDYKRLLTTLYNNTAAVYQTKHEPQPALDYFEKTLEIARESENRPIEAMALNNLGKLYMEEFDDQDKALQYMLESLEVRKQVGNVAELSRSYIQLSEYYRRQSDLGKAQSMALEALNMGKSIGSLEVQKNAYLSLSTIEEDRGALAESLKAFRLYKDISDSIRSQLAGDEVTRLQLQFDFEKAEQARILEAEQLRTKYILTIIVLGASLLIVGLMALVIRARGRQSELRRQGLAQAVELKNKELTTNVMYLVKKNELINNVAERLLEFKPRMLPENQKVVNEIIIDLQREGDGDMWREFEVRFNQVHGDFYEKLRGLYPDLSPADERLCAFLRLNMSSKEIAAITRQSVKSVEVSRARLRKKLNLTNTTSNLVTHLSKL